MRLEVVLNKLDELLSNEQSAHSESLLTRFSKQLRHLIHEGASHNIKSRGKLRIFRGWTNPNVSHESAQLGF